jgi:hypothetical protein
MIDATVYKDIDDFRRFIMLSLFRLRLYKTLDGNNPVYCVALMVRCEEPQGWIAIWRRCNDSLEKATELLATVETLAKNRLRDILIIEAYHQQQGTRSTNSL